MKNDEEQAPALEPIVLTAEQCAQLAAMSSYGWRRLVDAGEAPAPTVDLPGPHRQRRFRRWDRAQVEDFLRGRFKPGPRPVKRTG